MKDSYLEPADNNLVIKNSINSSFKRQEISSFSVIDRENISVSKNEFHAYNIPHTQSSKASKSPFGWNVFKNIDKYDAVVFGENESRIKGLLKCLIHEKDNIDVNSKDIHLFCPSSFFQYIVTQKTSKFDIVRYNDKIYISDKDRRLNQNNKMSYVGIRFEDILTLGFKSQTFDNINSFYSVVKTKINKVNCIYFTEIDSYDKSGIDGKFNVENYTEIKMILCKGKLPHHRMSDPNAILTLLSKGNFYFENFLLKLLVQCRFSLSHKVVIGIRDAAFNIRLVKEFSVDEDLIPFFQKKYPSCYNRYLHSIDTIERVMQWIEFFISDEEHENMEVFCFAINSSGYNISAVMDQDESQKILDKVIIAEYKEYSNSSENKA